jgi:DNA-binding response OmpR family regulator
MALHTSHQPLATFSEAEMHDSLLYAEPLRLDRFRDVAFFHGTEIALTPTEYLLLYCLLEGQGRVLSYQEIARNTHGYETSNTEAQALLKAHVSHLRHKIDPSYLVNVRGVGYRLATGHTHVLADENPNHGLLKNTLS